jgi:c-di-GMP-related signal transduction protein
MDVFVARQPIFTRLKKIFAYELLFRDSLANVFPDIDGETATSSLLSSTFLTVGIDNISGKHRVFINFTEDLLLRGTPTLFSREKIMVEVLENVRPTQEVIEACQSLKKKGYDLALDDFVYRQNLVPLIGIAKIIKIDFRLNSTQEVEHLVAALKGFPCRLLAEKVETHEEFQKAIALGFSYFQGYFFSQPEVFKNKDISSSQFTIIQLICEVNRVEFDIDKLEKIINKDVSISYKLLNYLNSAYFSRLQPLSSIRQAIIYLGERGTRLFVSLIATSQLAAHKPDELMKASIIRARFLELLGEEAKMISGKFFLLGLFSLIDAMLDNTMAYLIGQLPLTADVSEALVKRSGPLFPYLRLVELYEIGEWQELDQGLAMMNLRGENIVRYYLDAVKMADSYY